jgi:hypothetical protein
MRVDDACTAAFAAVVGGALRIMIPFIVARQSYQVIAISSSLKL